MTILAHEKANEIKVQGMSSGPTIIFDFIDKNCRRSEADNEGREPVSHPLAYHGQGLTALEPGQGMGASMRLSWRPIDA
ncbi:hypothetical protein [Mesorhizobium mediterraneum]|uniref:hypothetical protein n=1 Tax=Mesorhizobium mediterraneum TaxID=43617 RepID=UPI001781F9AF|nr:hypothetical protein [Mesorhizobium mediterraneum]